MLKENEIRFGARYITFRDNRKIPDKLRQLIANCAEENCRLNHITYENLPSMVKLICLFYGLKI